MVDKCSRSEDYDEKLGEYKTKTNEKIIKLFAINYRKFTYENEINLNSMYQARNK